MVSEGERMDFVFSMFNIFQGILGCQSSQPYLSLSKCLQPKSQSLIFLLTVYLLSMQSITIAHLNDLAILHSTTKLWA